LPEFYFFAVSVMLHWL